MPAIAHKLPSNCPHLLSSTCGAVAQNRSQLPYLHVCDSVCFQPYFLSRRKQVWATKWVMSTHIGGQLLDSIWLPQQPEVHKNQFILVLSLLPMIINPKFNYLSLFHMIFSWLTHFLEANSIKTIKYTWLSWLVSQIRSRSYRLAWDELIFI